MEAGLLPVAVVWDTDRALEVLLEVDVLEGDGRARLEPSVLFCLQPGIQTLLQLVELLNRCLPSNLHR